MQLEKTMQKEKAMQLAGKTEKEEQGGKCPLA